MEIEVIESRRIIYDNAIQQYEQAQGRVLNTTSLIAAHFAICHNLTDRKEEYFEALDTFWREFYAK